MFTVTLCAARRAMLMFCLLGPAIFCWAQSKSDTLFRPHWEIGADLLPLINKPNAPATTLFARRNYALSRGAGKAWRIRAGVDTDWRFYDGFRPKPDTIRSFAPYLSLGHEWQRHLSNRYRWFAAVDLAGARSRKVEDYLVRDTTYTHLDYKQYQIGIVASLGFQIKLVDNLSISLESALNAAYRHYEVKGYDYPASRPSLRGARAYGLDKSYKIGIYPIHVIHLIYTLKKQRHVNKK